MARILQMHEDWLQGILFSMNKNLPVIIARQNLEGWEEPAIRSHADTIYKLYQQWKMELGGEPDPPGYLSILTSKENAKAWECAGTSVTDPIDLLRHLRKTKYPPITDLIANHGVKVLLSVLVLKELADHSRLEYGYTGPRIVSALMGALEIILQDTEQMAQKRMRETLKIILPDLIYATRDAVISNQTKKAARVKHRHFEALRKKAIDLYNATPGNFKSIRQAARQITPILEEYGRTELGRWLTTDDPRGRVYEWLLKANKQGLLQKP